MKLWPNEPSVPPEISFASLVKAGLTDGLNPCALTAIIWLIIFLSVTGKTRYEILSRGAYFILAYLITSFSISLGLLDVAVAYLSVQTVLRYAQFFIAVVAIIAGAVNVFDWWQYSKDHDKAKQWLKYPAIFFADQKTAVETKEKDFWQDPAVYAWLLGILAAVFGSLWPQSYLMLHLNTGLYTGNTPLIFLLKFLTYQVVFVLPMILVFCALLYCIYSDRILLRWQQSLGLVKLIKAAVLLGWGISLVYLFL